MKKRVLSALLALCLTLSLAGAAFAENEPSGDSSSAASQAVSSVESEPQTQDETVSSGSVSGEDQTAAKTESTPAPTETPAASDVAEEEPESTPQPEAATEPDTTPAPTEDPVANVTENEESDGSVEYTAALETDGETMNVIVTAPEDAFAEGVQPKLSVTMLTAEDELNAVADKLDTAEVQYDGFAALDITFTDEATGEEIEPSQQVSVRIELPQAIVDSGIDLTTLAVQHLEEDADGNVQNVTEVATLDNGITLSEEAAAAANEAAGVAPMSDLPAEEATAGDATEIPAAVAEFDVDGFLSFVITWGEGNWYRENYFTLNMIYVDDEDYDEFFYNHANVNLNMPDLPDDEYYGNHTEGESVTAEPVRIDLRQYATNIAGYKECVAIRYNEPQSRQNVAYAEVTASGKWHYVTGRYFGDKYWTVTDITYTLTLYNNDNNEVDTVTTTNDGKSGNIYFVYKPDPTTEPTYDFTMQSGNELTKIDVQIFVYDESTNSYVLTDTNYPGYDGQNFNSWSAVNNAPPIEGYNLSYGQYSNGYDDGNQIWTTLGLDANVAWGRVKVGDDSYETWKVGNYPWDASPKTIRLYYDPVIQDSTAEPIEPAPGYEKTATLNEDGTYDLTLNVTGAIGSSNNQTKVDVLMIVDTSASMTNNNSSNMADAQEAMKELVAELEGKEGIDANYSIVTFSGPSISGNSGGDNDASVVLGWSAVNGTNLSDSNVYAAIDGISTVGGTNYQAGLVKGNKQLELARSDAMTVVIFLSDGQPTWSYYNGNGSNALGDSSDGWKDTTTEAKDMQCTYFYSVGIGDGQAKYLDDTAEWTSGYHDKTTHYGGLAYYVVASNPTDSRYYDTSNSDLTTIFNNIVASSTQIHVSNVHITDTLSKNVEAVLDQNGDPTKLEVKVTNANGDDVTSQITQIQKQNDSYVTGENNIYPSFTNGVLQLHFPANYTLEDDYTYSVTLTIEPSAAAERDYAITGVYPDKPDEHTGTHAYPIETEADNQKGYFSNVADSAKLTYRVEGDEQDTTKDYPMPVVQVQKGYLSLTKVLADGATVDPGTKFEFQISIPAQYQGTYNAVYVEDVTHTDGTVTFDNPQNNSVTAEIKLEAGQTIIIALPDGIDAVITESTEDYTPTWLSGTPIGDGILVKIQKTQKAEVTCTNTPIEVTGTLTLRKDVTLLGAESGSQDDDNAKNVVFQFKVTGPIDAVGKLVYDDPDDSAEDIYFEAENNRAVVTVSVTENAPVVIRDLPVGTYTVEEVNRPSEILDGTYYFDNTVEKNGASQNIELTKDGNAATISNTYTHYKSVIITKLVDNGIKDEIGMGDTTKKFHFTTAINEQAVSQANSETTNAVLSTNNAEWQNAGAEWDEDGYGLANNGTMTISKLKSTDELAIVETEANENGYHSSYTVNNETIESTWADKDISIDLSKMSGNTVNVVVTNNRPVVAPTGLEDNHTKPFGLMVGVAVMAGLALVGGAVVRRRRRWME
ncbi:MAG: VWA domain-containing protein [Gemmiger sp.]